MSTSHNKRKTLKLSRNYNCLTLEIPKNDTESSQEFNIENKINDEELKHIKIRKDKTSFLLYCSLECI